ncbi:MAG: hypothetical protein M1480_09830 [Bacteroidetes bacterium]|nr:hypothetical protein [Bacteroidota bacterium]
MQYFYVLNSIMFSRLIFGFQDKSITKKKLLPAIIIQIILSLAFGLSLNFILLLLVLLIIDLIFFLLEVRSSNLNSVRLSTLLSFVIVFGIFSSFLIPSEYNYGLFNFILQFRNNSFLISGLEKINWLQFNLILFGILILLNETNFAIRYFFEKFNLTPMELNNTNENKIDRKEYNAGRIIGMLERVLIFFFVLLNQYAAIGFIIAAKGFTRFRELDDRNFAEYVLIGTFLSALSAILIAIFVKSLI